MVEKELKGIEVFYNKNVVVKFLIEGELITTTGILSDFDEEDEDSEGYIVISTSTDYDRIPIKNIRKIYLKE